MTEPGNDAERRAAARSRWDEVQARLERLERAVGLGSWPAADSGHIEAMTEAASSTAALDALAADLRRHDQETTAFVQQSRPFPGHTSDGIPSSSDAEDVQPGDVPDFIRVREAAAANRVEVRSSA